MMLTPSDLCTLDGTNILLQKHQKEGFEGHDIVNNMVYPLILGELATSVTVSAVSCLGL